MEEDVFLMVDKSGSKIKTSIVLINFYPMQNSKSQLTPIYFSSKITRHEKNYITMINYLEVGKIEANTIFL